MSKQDKFSILLDEILEEIIKIDYSGKKYELPLITQNVIHLIRNLKEQLDEQRDQLIQMEDKIKGMQNIIRSYIKNNSTSTAIISASKSSARKR